jgi:Mg2+ and Co2+ transporter CorA
MQIPDQYVGWAMAAFGGVVAWLVRLEARLSARPTRQEQEAIAAKVAVKIDNQFDEIKRLLERQNEQMDRQAEQTSLHRDLMGASIAEIRTRVAVLRDRAGDDPLSETGAHRRRL